MKAVIEQFSVLIKQVIQKNLHRNDDVDLEDIEQEVRFKIWVFLKKGKKIQNFPSYIKKIAYSTTIDELRKMMKDMPTGKPENLRRVFSGASLVSSGPLSDFSPEAGLEGLEAKESIRALVNSLSKDRKKVLELYLKGLSIDEICSSLHWGKPRVRHLFYRGLDDLRGKSYFLQGNVAGNSHGNLPPGARQ
jgi:RNA polymerase sigma factor (sigma-70 family)